MAEILADSFRSVGLLLFKDPETDKAGWDRERAFTTTGQIPGNTFLSYLLLLKGHCRGDFFVFWSKLLKFLTRFLFANIKLSDFSLKNKL